MQLTDESIDAELAFIASRCLTLREALVATFGSIEEDEERLRVSCCGDMTYGSGVMGSDSARCKGCGKEVFNLMSPHVSPLLQSGHGSVIVPDQGMLDRFGERSWMSGAEWGETMRIINERREATHAR